MSAKLIYSLTSDENPTLRKQMGCINGFFHLFDRQHLSHSHNHKLPPPGHNNVNERVSRHTSQKNKEEKGSKVSRKAQRSSPETPRPSTSSTCSSSTLSSVECYRMTQPDKTFFNQNICPQEPSQDHRLNQAKNSVKGSNYVLPSPIKTVTKHNVVNQAPKHVDSPRPVKQCGVVDDRSRTSTLHKPRPTDSRKNAFAHPVVADKGRSMMEAPRRSYDGGRELCQKTRVKLKELPRLSLDSREKSFKQSSPTLKPDAFIIQDQQQVSGTSSRSFNSPQEPGSYRPLSNVVAKLMGLDDLPDTASTAESPIRPKKSSSGGNIDHLSRSSRSIDSSKLNLLSDSPRKNRTSLNTTNSDNANLNVKPMLSSTPGEAERTPWKQRDGQRPDTDELASQHQEEASMECQNLSVSLYGEIEKRLADLDFKKSGKDLRALKQILEAMQRTKSKNPCTVTSNQTAESISQTNGHSFHQDPRLAIRHNLHDDRCMRTTNLKKVDSTVPRQIQDRKSPTKQSEAVVKDRNSPNLCQPKIHGSINKRWESARKTETTKPNSRSPSFHELPCRTLSTLDKYPAARPQRTSTIPDQTSREKISIWEDQPQKLGPKLQNKNVRLENSNCASAVSSNLNRQLNRQPPGQVFPGQKSRPKSPGLQQSSQPQSSPGSESVSFSQQSETTSSHDRKRISQLPQIYPDVTRSSQVMVDSISKELAQGKSLVNSGDGLPTSLRIATREQSSPISVLDASFYEDESPSPVKKRTTVFRDNEASVGTEERWTETNNNDSLESPRPNFSSENNYQKPDNFQESIQKLWKLTPTQETLTSLCEHASSEEEYIFEILLASGLIGHIDCTAVVICIHQTGQAIHPSLFSILEKALSALSDRGCDGKENAMFTSNNSHQRRLIFDVVNEILLQRFSFTGFCSQSRLLNKFTGYGNARKQLPREICKEIDQLQTNSFHNLDNEDDFLTNMLSKDLTLGSENWTDFYNETPGLVLDIERLIYKDLIVELLYDEAGVSQVLERGCRRHLFSQ